VQEVAESPVKQQKSSEFTPVSDLSQFLAGWKIKVRLTKKHNLQSWNNAKGRGTLLNIELMDEEGTQIQGTFFNDQANKYSEKFV
jgi:replication factor A1